MGNTLTTQRLADDLARREGYFCASYLGMLPEFKEGRNLPVYKICSRDSREEGTAAPRLILGADSGLFRANDDDIPEILEKLTSPNPHARGKCLYGRLEFFRTQTLNASDRKYAQKLLDATAAPDEEGQVGLSTAYEYLEIAERFRAKVVVHEYEEANGAVCHYLSLA